VLFVAPAGIGPGDTDGMVPEHGINPREVRDQGCDVQAR